MGPFWAHGPRLGPWARAHGPGPGPGPIKCRFCQILHFYKKDAPRPYEFFAPNGAPSSLI